MVGTGVRRCWPVGIICRKITYRKIVMLRIGSRAARNWIVGKTSLWVILSAAEGARSKNRRSTVPPRGFIQRRRTLPRDGLSRAARGSAEWLR